MQHQGSEEGCAHVLRGKGGECLVCLPRLDPPGVGAGGGTPYVYAGGTKTQIRTKTDLISVNTCLTNTELKNVRQTLISVNKNQPGVVDVGHANVPQRVNPISIVSALAPPVVSAPAVEPAKAPAIQISDVTLEQIAAEERRRAADQLALIEAEEAKRLAPKARADLGEFMRQGWATLHPAEPLEWNWHLDTFARHLQALGESLLKARRDPGYQMPVKRAIFNVPPRTLKTESVGVFFLTWMWLHDASILERYISGIDKVRNAASRASRDLIASEWFQDNFKPKWQIRSDIDNISLYQNTARGYRYNDTYQSGITGTGTDIIVVDDPIDAKRSDSEVIRPKVNLDWDNAIENRVQHRLRYLQILIMQRLHEADLSGHCIAKGTWRHVVLPMEYEPELACKCPDCQKHSSFLGPYDPRTTEGELLFPGMFPLSEVDVERAKGELYFAGQMQQRPAPAEGGMFKKKFWSWYGPGAELPKFRRTCIFIDTAAKKTLTGSRTAMLVLGEERRGPRKFGLDGRAFREDFRSMVKNAKELRKKYPRARIVIEDKAAGSSLITELKKELGGVIGWDPKNDSKESRAHSVTGIVEAGDVWLPEGAAWANEFVYECAVFPNGANDDYVDVLSMGLSYLRGEASLTSWAR